MGSRTAPARCHCQLPPPKGGGWWQSPGAGAVAPRGSWLAPGSCSDTDNLFSLLSDGEALRRLLAGRGSQTLVDQPFAPPEEGPRCHATRFLPNARRNALLEGHVAQRAEHLEG